MYHGTVGMVPNDVSGCGVGGMQESELNHSTVLTCRGYCRGFQTVIRQVGEEKELRVKGWKSRKVEGIASCDGGSARNS